MKNLNKLVLLLLCTLNMVACSDSETKSEKEVVLSKLTANTWILSNAKVDEKLVTGAFDALALTFTKSTITAVNAVPPIWANTSFELEKNGDVYVIVRSDDVTVEVVSISKNKLVLELQYNAGSKVSSISGNYIFEFNAP